MSVASDPLALDQAALVYSVIPALVSLPVVFVLAAFVAPVFCRVVFVLVSFVQAV